jgi:outer membrane protein OmpA-like peptidoglycan-associated protein
MLSGINKNQISLKGNLLHIVFCLLLNGLAAIPNKTTAQDSTKTVSTHFAIYFEVNQHKLTAINQQKIDSLMASVPFDRIFLEGYADSTGNFKYNMQLSKKRAEEIAGYINTRHGYFNVDWSYKGQAHTANNDLANQRRVDIVFYKDVKTGPVKPEVSIITIEEPVKKEVTKKTVSKVILPQASPDKEAKMKEIFTQDVIVFEQVLFEPGSAEFLHNEIPNELYYLAQALDSVPTMRIEIAGHVCCIDNMKLSQKRAKTVVDFLVAQGIDKKRLTHKGYSNYQPRVKELTPEDERLNRRVEVIILER